MTGQPRFTVLVGWALSDVEPEASGRDGMAVGIGTVEDLRDALPALATCTAAILRVADDTLLDIVVGELRRLGTVAIRRPDGEAPGPRVVLSDESTRLLDLLAGGASLGDAAAALHLSRRTADRRLAEAKRALGASTTPQVIATYLEGRRSATSSAPQVESLIGRDEELGRALAAVSTDRTVLVVGEGGIGKTALLRAVARLDGRTTRAASGMSLMSWREYWPLSRALAVDDLAGDAESVASLVESAAGPDVLLLDDLHLADSSTLEVVAALVGRVAMLCASRPEVGADERVIARLGEAGAEVVTLAALSDEDAAQLLHALAPDVPRDRADAVVAGAAGLPLLLEYLCGADDDAPVGRGLVPGVEALTPDLLQVATVLALSGRSVACDGEDLERAGLAVGDARGRFRIRHQLMADAVLERAPADVVAAAHVTLATAAETPGEAAQHWFAAGDLGRARAEALRAHGQAASASDRARLRALAARCLDGAEATDEMLAAAEDFVAVGLHEDALELVGSLAVEQVDPVSVARVHLIRARASWHGGDAAAAVRNARDGLALVGGSGSPVEAHLLIESVRCEVLSTGIAEDHDERLARAGDIIGDGPGRAALLNVSAILPYFRTGEGLAEWQAGHAAALAEGDTDTLMRCANNIIMWNEASGDQAAALDMALSMAREAADRGLGAWELQFTAAAATLMYHRGRYGEAMPMLERVLAEARDTRTLEQARVVQQSILIDLGMLDAARRGLPPLPAADQQDSMHDNAIFYLHAALELAAGRSQRVVEISRVFAERARTDLSGWVFLLPLVAWANHDLGRRVEPTQEESPIPLVHGLIREAQGVALIASDLPGAQEALDEAADLGLQWSRAAGLRAQWGAAEVSRLAGSPDAVARLLAVEAAVSDMGMEPLLARVRRSLRLAGVTRAARRERDRSGLLTSRERLVLDLLAGGATYAEISRRLGLGRPAVRRLSESAQLKLGAGSRAAAVAASALV